MLVLMGVRVGKAGGGGGAGPTAELPFDSPREDSNATKDIDEIRAHGASTDEPPLAPGTVLADKYVVEREIARGGIGVILIARHVKLEQRVAIKYLQSKVLDNPAIVERFAREARLAAQIRSEHVVRVHDVATHPDLGPYMVMEYLEGSDLGQLLQAGPIPIARAVDYVLQACDALVEAHALGIVHRDLKPDNLFLANRAAGQSIVKILDFGISKSTPKHRESGGWAHVTTGSETFGTPVYMSPEQLRSTANVDARSDIWALGVVLFELLTTELPFSGNTIAQLCTSIITDPPRKLHSLRKNAPAELEATLVKCLEKDPSRRFRNVAELAQELARFAPPGSEARIQHIKRVIQQAGASVRPPAPAVGTFQVGGPSSQASGPSLGPKPSSGAPKPVLALVPAASPARRRAAITLGAAALVVLVVVLARTLGGTPSEAGNRETKTSTMDRTPTVAPAPTPTPMPTGVTELSPVPTETSSTTTLLPPPSPLPPASAVESNPRARPPAHPRPTPSVHDDYSEFGERR
jgi:serine/threonine protein kinase